LGERLPPDDGQPARGGNFIGVVRPAASIPGSFGDFGDGRYISADVRPGVVVLAWRQARDSAGAGAFASEAAPEVGGPMISSKRQTQTPRGG